MKTRIARQSSTVVSILGLVGAVAGGCLTRPVVSNPPVTNITIEASVFNRTIDKIDLLFVIDNSASMGDKQEYLGQAVPDLITRLVTPNCVDAATGTVYGPSDRAGNGTCAQGTVEFPPVHDMHIGVISTSLGTRLSEQFGNPPGSGTICDPSATVTVGGVTLNAHNDDRGELLNRAGAMETALSDAGGSFYLNFFPTSNPKNANKMPSPGAPAIRHPPSSSWTSRPSSRAWVTTVAGSSRSSRAGTASSSSPTRTTPWRWMPGARRSGRASTRRSSSSATTSCVRTRSSPSST